MWAAKARSNSFLARKGHRLNPVEFSGIQQQRIALAIVALYKTAVIAEVRVVFDLSYANDIKALAVFL